MSVERDMRRSWFAQLRRQRREARDRRLAEDPYNCDHGPLCFSCIKRRYKKWRAKQKTGGFC